MGRQVTIGNPPITVDLRRSQRAKRLSLRVSRLDGRVSLTMPQGASEREAMGFLTGRERWLRDHLSQVASPHTVRLGSVIPFRGGQLSVAPAAVRRTRCDGDKLLVPADENPGARIKAFLRLAARDVLAARSDAYAAALGVSYTRLSLRDTRSRWGSCSSKGVLMYSWRLIMAPPEVLDYVAAHEVAHLVEMNHSSAFWAVVAKLMPEYQSRRNWLRDHGDQLHRFQFV